MATIIYYTRMILSKYFNVKTPQQKRALARRAKARQKKNNV